MKIIKIGNWVDKWSKFEQMKVNAYLNLYSINCTKNIYKIGEI